ncbi:MAG: type IV secretory system conjugative DNA transfer family protein [Clostridiales bacterium]|nr:type IV secretory system conjugative DNA transfer family protein [Clostridiales bacterium]
MVIDKSIFEGYEDSKLCRYDDPVCDFPTTCAFEDLPKTSVSGVLKANRYVDGKLMQTYSELENHVCVIAATRLGKTTSYVIPSVISNAIKPIKRSMIISDPKGEIYRHTARTLQQEGYIVKMINFRDYRHSECWNPLTPIFRKFKWANSLENEVKPITKNGKQCYRFMENIYQTKEELNEAISLEKEAALDDVYNDIDIFGVMMVPTTNKDDQMWDEGARSLFVAFIIAMLEDSLVDENPITEETFSLDTILNIFATFGGEGMSYDRGYFSNRPVTSKAYMFAKDVILIAAEKTRGSFIANFSQKMSEFRSVAIRRLTMCDSFEMDTLLGAKPVAIFLCYRDEVKAHYKMISLFVQNAYKLLIDFAQGYDDNKLPTPFYFILDEFGNFPQMNSFENVISACAGRNIWFTLVLQSYAQLNAVYGDNTAKIILDNLNVKVMLGSLNWQTVCEFAESCGLHARLSPESALNGSGEEIEHYKIETIPLVTKSMLSKLKSGECIVTEANSGYVMFSRLERYYMCPEFNNLPLADEKKYKCSVNPLDSKYRYIYNERIAYRRRFKFNTM